MNIEDAKRIIRKDPPIFLAAIMELLEWKVPPPPLPAALQPPICVGFGEHPCPDRAIPVRIGTKGMVPIRCQACRDKNELESRRDYARRTRVKRTPPACAGYDEHDCPDQARVIAKGPGRPYPKRCPACREKQLLIWTEKSKANQKARAAGELPPASHPQVDAAIQKAIGKPPKLKVVSGPKGIDYSKTEFVGRAELQELARKAGILKKKEQS